MSRRPVNKTPASHRALAEATNGHPVSLEAVFGDSDLLLFGEKHADTGIIRLTMQALPRLWDAGVRHVVLELWEKTPELATLRKGKPVSYRSLALGAGTCSPVLDIAFAASALGMKVYGGDSRDPRRASARLRRLRDDTSLDDAAVDKSTLEIIDLTSSNASMARTTLRARAEVGGRGLMIVGAAHAMAWEDDAAKPIGQDLLDSGVSTSLVLAAGGFDQCNDWVEATEIVKAAERAGIQKPFLWHEQPFNPATDVSLFCKPVIPIDDEHLEAMLFGVANREDGLQLFKAVAEAGDAGDPRSCEVMGRYHLNSYEFPEAARWYEQGAAAGDPGLWLDAARTWAIYEAGARARNCHAKAVARQVPGARLLADAYAGEWIPTPTGSLPVGASLFMRPPGSVASPVRRQRSTESTGRGSPGVAGTGV